MKDRGSEGQGERGTERARERETERMTFKRKRERVSSMLQSTDGP